MCNFMFSMLSKTESPGVTDIETHDRKTGSASRQKGVQHKWLRNVTELHYGQVYPQSMASTVRVVSLVVLLSCIIFTLV